MAFNKSKERVNDKEICLNNIFSVQRHLLHSGRVYPISPISRIYAVMIWAI